MDPIDDVSIQRDQTQTQTIVALAQFIVQVSPPLLDMTNVEILRDHLALDVTNENISKMVLVPDITMLFVAYDKGTECTKFIFLI